MKSPQFQRFVIIMRASIFFAHVALLAGLSHAVHVKDDTQGRLADDPADAEAATAKAEAEKKTSDEEVAKITSETEAMKKKCEADTMRSEARRKAEDAIEGAGRKEEASRIKANGEANLEKMKKGYEVDKQFLDVDESRDKQLTANLEKAKKDGKTSVDKELADTVVRKQKYAEGIVKRKKDMVANDKESTDKAEVKRQEMGKIDEAIDKKRNDMQEADWHLEWAATQARNKELRKETISIESKDVADAAKKTAKDLGKDLIG